MQKFWSPRKLICNNACDLSLLQVPNFWKIYSYDIGGLVYSLDDIEHGVLRANKGNKSDVGSHTVLIVTLIGSVADPDPQDSHLGLLDSHP